MRGAAILVAVGLAWNGSLAALESAYQTAAEFAPGWRHDEDLTTALDGGVGRILSTPITPSQGHWADLAQAQPGNDTLLSRPGSFCWRGGMLAVADESRQRVMLLTEDGKLNGYLGRAGTREGEFNHISTLRCGTGPVAFLVADGGNGRITFFTEDGARSTTVVAPQPPQPEKHLGDYALAESGEWFDSWLGLTRPAGPYLTDAQWSSVKLVRAWDRGGTLRREFGGLTPYRNRVARRVFNRTFLALHRDTLWVLTQANARVQGFDHQGDPAAAPILLPIHFRGVEPKVVVGGEPDQTGWRPNRLVYQPNVRGLAIVQDSLFATIRYREWALATVGVAGNRWIDYFPKSAVEIVDRHGRVIESLAVRGRAVAVASDGHSRLAVLSEDQDGSRRMFVAAVSSTFAHAAFTPCTTTCLPTSSSK